MAKKPPVVSWREPIDVSKLQAFYDRVQAMADMEFGVDDEGDSTVEVRLTDRTRYQRNHYRDVPYDGFQRKDGSDWGTLEACDMNRRMANSAFDTMMSVVSSERRRLLAAPAQEE